MSVISTLVIRDTQGFHVLSRLALLDGDRAIGWPALIKPAGASDQWPVPLDQIGRRLGGLRPKGPNRSRCCPESSRGGRGGGSLAAVLGPDDGVKAQKGTVAQSSGPPATDAIDINLSSSAGWTFGADVSRRHRTCPSRAIPHHCPSGSRACSACAAAPRRHPRRRPSRWST